MTRPILVLLLLAFFVSPAAAAQQAAEAKQATKAARKAKRAEGPEIKPDQADLSYGPHPPNKLDLWLAKSEKPTPLVVFIHGGGFVGGDKGSASGQAIRQCLDAVFPAIPYCIDLIGGPFLECNEDAIKAFRPI